jgi:hypothetical protein
VELGSSTGFQELPRAACPRGAGRGARGAGRGRGGGLLLVFGPWRRAVPRRSRIAARPAVHAWRCRKCTKEHGPAAEPRPRGRRQRCSSCAEAAAGFAAGLDRHQGALSTSRACPTRTRTRRARRRVAGRPGPAARPCPAAASRTTGSSTPGPPSAAGLASRAAPPNGLHGEHPRRWAGRRRAAGTTASFQAAQAALRGA